MKHDTLKSWLAAGRSCIASGHQLSLADGKDLTYGFCDQTEGTYHLIAIGTVRSALPLSTKDSATLERLRLLPGDRAAESLGLNTYQRLAARTIDPNQSHRDSLANFGLGLWEAGETGNLIKKHLYHGHDLDSGEIAGELGDILWYVAGIATTLGITLEEVAQGNIVKLKKRYPKGFSSADSLARLDVEKE